MADLAPLFALAQRQVTEAVRTAGTVLQVRHGAKEDIDDRTLERTLTGGTERPLDAIVVKVGATDAVMSPGVEIRSGDWRITLSIEDTAPVEGDYLVVTRSRGGVIEGDVARVIGVQQDSTGAYTAAFARPQWAAARSTP